MAVWAVAPSHPNPQGCEPITDRPHRCQLPAGRRQPHPPHPALHVMACKNSAVLSVRAQRDISPTGSVHPAQLCFAEPGASGPAVSGEVPTHSPVSSLTATPLHPSALSSDADSPLLGISWALVIAHFLTYHYLFNEWLPL